MGALAKTDRVDCRMLAILGESLEPDAAAPRSELMETLQELTRCRDAAVAARTTLLNQLGATTTRPAAVEIKRQLRAAETAIENLGAEIEALIGADPRPRSPSPAAPQSSPLGGKNKPPCSAAPPQSPGTGAKAAAPATSGAD